MTNPLQNDQAYELFIYTLAEHFPAIHRSTLTFVRRGGGLARIAGELHFAHTFHIVVRERLVYQRYPVVMIGMATRCGKAMKSSIGTIPNRTLTNQRYKALTPITNMCRQI